MNLGNGAAVDMYVRYDCAAIKEGKGVSRNETVPSLISLIQFCPGAASAKKTKPNQKRPEDG